MAKRFKFEEQAQGSFAPTILNQITHPFPCFSLTQPNRYRQTVQVFDLISLDLEYSLFEKARLALAVLLISNLIAYQALILPCVRGQQVSPTDVHTATRQLESTVFNVADDQPLVHEILTKFLSSVCDPLLGQKCCDVAQMYYGLEQEMRFAVKFFMLQPEYREPSRKLLNTLPGQKRLICGQSVQPWASKSEYLSIHTFTN